MHCQIGFTSPAWSVQTDSTTLEDGVDLCASRRVRGHFICWVLEELLAVPTQADASNPDPCPQDPILARLRACFRYCSHCGAVPTCEELLREAAPSGRGPG